MKSIKSNEQLDIGFGNYSLDITESRIRNDRQTIFSLTRELVHAQFLLADQELTNRLWNDVADRKIDIERIINLMYGCSCYEDDEMLELDLIYEKNNISINESNK